MAGLALGAFTDGLFRGVEARHGWEDRKASKARQKRLDEITDAQERRAQEAHDARMGIYGREATEWSEQRAQEARLRAAARRSVELTQGAGVMPQVDPSLSVPQPQGASAPRASTAVAPETAAEGVALGLGIDPRELRRSRAAEMMQQTMPVQSLGAAVPATAGPQTAPGPRRPEAGGETFVEAPRRIARTHEEKLAIIRAAKEGRLVPSAAALAAAEDANRRTGLGVTYDDWREMDRTARSQAGLPVSEIGGQLHFDRFSAGLGAKDSLPNQMAAAPLKAADRVAGAAAAAASGVNGALWDAASGAVRVIGTEGDKPLADAMEGRAEKSYDMAKTLYRRGLMGTGAAQTAATEAPAAAPVAPPPNIPVKAFAKPEEKAASASTAATMEQAASPAAKEATTAATKAMGVREGQRTISEAQYARGAKSFADRYLEIGAPVYFEALIKEGEFDKAKAFQEWMQTAETNRAMKDIGTSVTAFLLGDADKGAAHMVEAFNNLGYYPDGTTVEKSQFTKGKDGEINGLVITMKDGKSGHTFEQVFTGGVNDLLSSLLPAMMPEQAFEHVFNMASEAQKGAMGAIERSDKKAEAQAKADESILKAAQDLVKDSMPPGSMTLDQAINQVLAARDSVSAARATAGAAADGPTWIHRPN